MIATAAEGEPPERFTGLGAPVNPAFTVELEPGGATLPTTLRAWSESARDLRRRGITAATLRRLEDWGRIAEELGHVLAGAEPGEGPPEERALRAALRGGRIEAVAAMFACPCGTFIELLVAAPWNLLGPEDPPYFRSVRGAGTALLAEAIAWSSSRRCGGRVALQAENPRAQAFYERVGFRPMCATDRPLSLVPRQRAGWSPSLVRLANGLAELPGAKSPWLVLAPGAAAPHLRQLASTRERERATGLLAAMGEGGRTLGRVAERR